MRPIQAGTTFFIFFDVSLSTYIVRVCTNMYVIVYRNIDTTYMYRNINETYAR